MQMKIHNMSSEKYCYVLQEYDFPKDKYDKALEIHGNVVVEHVLSGYKVTYFEYWKCSFPEKKFSIAPFVIGDQRFTASPLDRIEIAIDDNGRASQTYPTYCFEDMGHECD